MERGQPMPEGFGDEPLLLPGDEFFLSSFYELNTCRTFGLSVGPIPWRDIIYYAKFAELSKDLIPCFILSIRAMDRVYMEWLQKTKKTEKVEKNG